MCNSISLCISGEEVKNLKHNKCCLNSLHFLQILQLSSFVFCSQICGFLWVVKFKEKIIHLGGLLTFDATFWIRNICCQATLILRKKRLIFNSQVVPKRDLARYIKWNKLFCVSVQLFMNAMDWNMIEILDCLKDIRFGISIHDSSHV